MAQREALNSPFGNSADNLGSPVPGQAEEEDLLAGLDLGEPAAIEGEGEVAEEDEDLLAGLDLQEGGELTEESFETENPTFEENLDPKRLLSRLKASFAVTESEKQGLLEKIYGAENIKNVDGSFKIRRPGTEVFTEFDPGIAFDIVGDMLDFSREATEEAVGLAGAIGGVGVGAAAAGPAGIHPGLIGGRALGVAMGVQVADAIGESLIGIERDPTRSALLESTIAGGITAAIPIVGGRLARNAANRSASKARSIKESHLIERASREALEAEQELIEQGIAVQLPGTNSVLRVDEIAGQSARAKEILDKALKDTGVKAFLQKYDVDRAKHLTNVAEDILRVSARTVGKDPDNIGSPIATVVRNAVDTARRADGKLIGEYRATVNEALSGTGGKVQLHPEAREAALDLAEQLGFTFSKAGTLIPPKLDDILQQTGLPTAGAARAYVDNLSKIFGNVRKGISFDDLEGQINLLAKGFKTSQKAGGAAHATYSRFSSSLRRMRNDMVRSSLKDPADLKRFEDAMENIESVFAAERALGKSIIEGQTSKSFINTITGNGKEALNRLGALRSVFKESNPEAWNAIQSEFSSKLIRDHIDPKSGVLNFSKFSKKIAELDPQLLKTMYGGTDVSVKNLLAFGKLTNKIKNVDFTKLPEDKVNNFLWNTIKATAGIGLTKISGIYGASKAILGFKNADKAFQLLNKNGIDKFLESVPAGERGLALKTIDGMMKMANATGATQVLGRGAEKEFIREGLAGEEQ